MANFNPDKCSFQMQVDGWTGNYELCNDAEVGMYFAHEVFTTSADLNYLLEGLPDNECQIPHYGYVIRGKWGVIHDGKEEIYNAGEAFYVPPGHIGRYFAGTEIIYFSPLAEDFADTFDSFCRNIMKVNQAKGEALLATIQQLKK